VRYVLVCGLASGIAWFSVPVQAASGPTYDAAITTSVNGNASPQGLGRAEWSQSGATYELTAKTVAPPSGRTVLLANWHSGLVTIRHGQELVHADVDLTDQPGLTGAAATIVQQYRTCRKKRACDRWHKLVQQVPPFIDLKRLLGGENGGGAGVAATWEDGKATVDIQWQLVVTGIDGDYVDLQASVAR
jgi:hypothetical protein